MLAAPLLALAFTGTALAEPMDSQQNSREQCRMFVSGYFLNIHETVRMQDGMVQRLSHTIDRLARAETLQKKSLAALHARKKPGVFDADLEQAIMAAEDRARQLATEKAEDQQNLQQAAEALKQAKVRHGTAQKELETVFQVRLVKNDDVGYATYDITYRTSCPKYRTLCPLPASERQALARLLPPEDLPEPCRRYSQIRE